MGMVHFIWIITISLNIFKRKFDRIILLSFL